MKQLAFVLAVVFLIVAVLYWTGITPLGHHVKHGVLFFILALLCLIWMRFSNTDTATSRR